MTGRVPDIRTSFEFAVEIQALVGSFRSEDSKMVQLVGSLWERKEESRALSGFRFNPYPSSVTFHDLLTIGKSDAGTRPV